MAVLSEHQTSVVVDLEPLPVTLQVTAQSIEMDEEWTPYIQASLTCPLGDGAITALDPQSGDIWATVHVRRLLGRIDRIADLTRKYRGRPLSDLSAEFAGGDVAEISASTYHDYEIEGHPKRSEGRDFRLMVRESVIDWKAATVDLKLASGDARPGDWLHMSGATYSFPGATLRDKIDYVLELSGFPEGLTYASGPNPTDAAMGDEKLRAPASSAADYIAQMTRQHGLMCWCDEDGKWHIAANRNKPATRTLSSFGDDRSVVNALEKRSRDDGWVTAVMLIYTWEGATYYDIASPFVPFPEKARVIRYEKPYPGPGRAAIMLEQLKTRGRSLELLAVSSYLITPGEVAEYVSPRGTLSGRVAAVRWQWPADEMSVRLREVEAA
jgi:hypothetical protein